MQQGRLRSVQWVKPHAPPRVRGALVPALERVKDFVAHAIQEVGLPASLPGESPVEEARRLLQVAAEIEHGLLVQYLYAASSLDTSLGTPIVNWRNTLVSVAVEEMGHLISLQNLLMAVGSVPYFDRENYPIDPFPTEHYPFPYMLEPVTEDALAKYVVTESPLLEQLPEDLRAKMEQIIRQAKGAAGTLINHVGALYAKLYWLFQEQDEPQGPWELPAEQFAGIGHLAPDDFVDFHDLQALQADPDEWQGTEDGPLYVRTVPSREYALETLYLIAAQGEGWMNEADSHFLRLLRLYEEYVKSVATEGRRPTLNVPIHPNTATTPYDEPALEEGRITYPAARLWALLCNVRYRMLLQAMALAIVQPKGSNDGLAGRQALIDRAINLEMRGALRRIPQLLVKLPRRESATDELAGPPFELPLEALPTHLDAQWQAMRQYIHTAKDLIAQIRMLPSPDAPMPPDLQLLRRLENADDQLLAAIPV